MATRTSARDEGAADARRLCADAGNEIKLARRRLGWSQAVAGKRAGMSVSQWSRLERGDTSAPTLDQLCRAGRAVGLDPAFRYYAAEVPVNDRGQLPVLERFAGVLGGGLRMAREVGLAIQGDQRAWDARVTDGTSGREWVSVDCEARLGDIQAVTRRVTLKQRDDPASGPVILLVARTRHNRAVLEVHREALRAAFPLDGAQILRFLRSGRVPPAGGILVM
jgi:transcriptional regulator with XRE-family HTH domain